MADPSWQRPVVIDGKIGALPFHDVFWNNFEKLVWELVQASERLSPCHRYGTPGQAQAGIDIAGQSTDGRWHAFQVKQVARFGEADARRALDLFLHGPRPYGATRLVIVVSCKDTPTQVRDLVDRYRAQHPDVELELWDADELARRLRQRPRIVARYCGDEVARRFCDADALRAFYESQDSSEVGWLVSETDPFSLEVHEAIAADHGAAPAIPALPTYFRRPFDDRLDAAVSTALAGNSVMRVLLADSSTGKTRAAWEAIQRLPGEWRLWHPADQDDLLASLAAVKPRTVVWLNEINRYLLSADPGRDERIAARLTELLRDQQRAPVLILGTTWHTHWITMTSAPGDERAKTRALLAKCVLRLPERFSDDEVAALLDQGEHNDPRMLQAVREAESGHVIQYLAGGPAQLERYTNASPAAQAVLHAAMDARRFGHGLDLPHAFLRAAAEAYLTPLQRDLAEPDWFPRALQYLSAPCRGVRGPLAPAAGFTVAGTQNPRHFRLADYVELHGQRHRRLVCPEDAFWAAAADHAASAQDKVALSRAALDRGRAAEAETLALAAAEEGVGTALSALAAWIGRHRKGQDPYVYYELAAGLGDVTAQLKLAFRAEDEDRPDDAERWYRKVLDRDNSRSDAVVGLATVRAQRGDHAHAVELYDQALRSGFFGARAVEYQARSLAHRDQHELALAMATHSFRAGNTEAFTGLAWTYRYNDVPRAIRVLEHAGAEGDANAPRELAWILEEEGDSERAEFYCEIAVALGEINTLRGLGMIRRGKGNHRSAAALFWRAYNLDLTYVLLELAVLREKEGSLKQAEKLYRRALDEGQPSAARDLVRILETRGKTRQAEELAADFTDLLGALARGRAARGEHKAAEQLLLRLVAQGHPELLVTLAELREQRGDLAGAQHVLHRAQDAGVRHLGYRLARLQDVRST